MIPIGTKVKARQEISFTGIVIDPTNLPVPVRDSKVDFKLLADSDWIPILIDEEYYQNLDWAGFFPYFLVCESNCIILSQPQPQPSLKVLNSESNRTLCAKCSHPLKTPYPRIKFCPMCEP